MQQTFFFFQTSFNNKIFCSSVVSQNDIVSLGKKLKENTSALALLLCLCENHELDLTKLGEGLKQNIKLNLIEIYIKGKKITDKLPAEIEKELDANSFIWKCMNYINKNTTNKKLKLSNKKDQQIIIDKILGIKIETAHKDTLNTMSILLEKLILNIPEEQKEAFDLQVEKLNNTLLETSLESLKLNNPASLHS